MRHLDEQLDEIYARIQPPREFLDLLRLEINEIVAKRKKTAGREVSGLKRKIAEIEAKEMKLLDEMLAGKVAKSIYEKMQKSYSEGRKRAESRLSQLDVDYDDPIAFLNKALTVAGLLPALHGRFKYEQRKTLLKAVFKTIEVEDRMIVGVKLNPPFSIFMGDDGGKVFENAPSLAALQDVFEQLVQHMLSPQFPEAVDQINRFLREYESSPPRRRAA